MSQSPASQEVFPDFRANFRPNYSDLDFMAGIKVVPYIVVNLVLNFCGHRRWWISVTHEAHAQPLVAERGGTSGVFLWCSLVCCIVFFVVDMLVYRLKEIIEV